MAAAILYFYLELRAENEDGSTFQKELNLKLYISQHSEHPIQCLRGWVTEMIIRFWEQNTSAAYFAYFTKDFF